MAIETHPAGQTNWWAWGGGAAVAILLLAAFGYGLGWFGTGTSDVVAPVTKQVTPATE